MVQILPFRGLRYNLEKLAAEGAGLDSVTTPPYDVINDAQQELFYTKHPANFVRIDLNKGEANILISDEEIERRRADLQAQGGYKYPANQTPWQEIQRGIVDQLGDGAVLKPAVKYQRLAQTAGIPRDNH